MIILIHWDFTEGTELSYVEGLHKVTCKQSFTTNCLEFFNSDLLDKCDIVVKKKSGEYISAKELLMNDHFYTRKHMRKPHDIRKMLVAGSFHWKSKWEGES